VTDENGTHFFSYVEGKPKAPADAMDVIHGEGEFVYLTLSMGGLTCRRVRSIDQSDSGTYVCETETVLKPYIEEMGGKMRFVDKELYLYDSYAWLMDDGELLLSGYGRFVGSDDAILYVPFTAGQNMVLYDGDQRVLFDDITSYTRTADDCLLLLRAKNALTLVDADGALIELMTFDEGIPVPNAGFMVRVGEKVLYVDTNGKVIVTLDGWYEGLILERVESGDSLEGGMVFVDPDDKNKEGYPKKVIFHYDSQTGRFTVDERYAPLMTDMDSCCVPNAIPYTDRQCRKRHCLNFYVDGSISATGLK
jgi:hypothetical protein